MIDRLIDGYDSIIKGYQDFWLVSGAVDISFETGTTSRNKEVRAAMEPAGFDSAVLQAKQNGPSELLQNWLLTRYPEYGDCRSNRVRTGAGRTRRPDLEFGSREGSTKTAVEIKIILETTTPSFYGFGGNNAAEDYVKLEEYVDCQYKFLLVFFLSLPNYDYPAGECIDSKKKVPMKSRDCYRNFKKVDEQFRRLRNYLPKATFPASEDAAFEHHLDLPSEHLIRCLNAWSSKVYWPADTTWEYTRQHFQNATVGYAIWSR